MIEGDPNGFNIPLGGYPEANERPGIGADWRPADQRMADEQRFDEEYNEAQDRQKKDPYSPVYEGPHPPDDDKEEVP